MCNHSYLGFWNVIDWLGYLGLLVYFGFFHGAGDPFGIPHREDVDHLLGMFILITMYYRSFSQLRIFDSFTMIVGMINTILLETRNFFFILFFFFVASSFLLLKLKTEKKIDVELTEMYIWGVFGGIDLDAFNESPKYAYIPIVFGTILITIVLLNILIAYLSEIFATLESKQQVLEMKEKAGLALDSEVIKYLFRHSCGNKRVGVVISEGFYDSAHRLWVCSHGKEGKGVKLGDGLASGGDKDLSHPQVRRTQLIIIKEQENVISSERDPEEAATKQITELTNRITKMVPELIQGVQAQALHSDARPEDHPNPQGLAEARRAAGQSIIRRYG